MHQCVSRNTSWLQYTIGAAADAESAATRPLPAGSPGEVQRLGVPAVHPGQQVHEVGAHVEDQVRRGVVVVPADAAEQAGEET